ncbi:MAG: hypothetical protein COY11_01435 [Candidatus Portnoybacteria bacterium CG_4_10_14_0_2_um_filter_44_20]|uniref:Uncharacterized protein n=2 Tax=Candidatus Portnoyibacteriota TaxID=1817913 RepID=A0A2H0KSE0_9BACT|nr:MAG: hypothetical protein AUK17_00905 [Parcubacteria group bacterium CG2_30_44_18]PIQ74195.1 MAG: hypothetical protein COV85_03435 [Candidatus Portnoybacteria bacterium CG11_big_fil_rev_8_21_14_0_20_44_10]PIZ71432.1 MAG: hypothetical protein COY11_01435 [Candidatus Portnoybacteria bacterium CG_4_10_14_0_2_um_filter_44_20]
MLNGLIVKRNNSCFKIRISKSEIRNPKQYPITKIPTLRVVTRRVKNVCFGHLDLEFVICFELRDSNFEFYLVY